MRKKILGILAAFAMTFTTVGVSVAPTEAQAQSYRGDRGVHRDRNRRYNAPRRGYRGYRNNRSYRGHRGYRNSRSYRNNRYRNPRAYRDHRGYNQRRHHAPPRRHHRPRHR